MAEAIGGYDFEFIEDVPEDLICTLCHFALKNPVQIESCGHTFCEDCFNQTKDHAATNSTDFCCPLDRQVIDINRVFNNKADERKVLNLKVKCRYFVDECDWIGELRDAAEHETKCLKNKSIRDKTFEVDMIQLLNRMTEIESKLQTNEEKVKANEQKLVEKDQQIENQNKQIEYQCKITNEQNKAIKDLKEEMNNQSKVLNEKNRQIINQNKQMKDLKVQVENQNKKIINLQLYQSAMIIPDIEDGSNFTGLNTAFQWKFNPQEVRASYGDNHILLSPPFYNLMNSFCFQLGVNFVDNKYKILLFRFRGKYDADKDMTATTQSFDFILKVLGKKGKQKEFKSSNDDGDFSIPTFRERNDGLSVSINNGEIASLTVDGFVHLHCFFK